MDDGIVDDTNVATSVSHCRTDPLISPARSWALNVRSCNFCKPQIRPIVEIVAHHAYIKWLSADFHIRGLRGSPQFESPADIFSSFWGDPNRSCKPNPEVSLTPTKQSSKEKSKMLLMQMLRHKETLCLNLYEVLSLGIGLGKHLQSPWHMSSSLSHSFLTWLHPRKLETKLAG